jgi:cation transport ATPase
MKTVTVDVGGLLSPLSVRGVEKQLARLPGVERADVNFASGTATVVFDESRATLAAIKATVRACGYHCRGEQLPKHVCEPVDPPAEAIATAAPSHVGHGAAHAVPKDAMAHEMDLAPPKASVQREGREVEVPTAEVIVNDVVVIRPGNKIPVDGEVMEGGSLVDESMPVSNKPGNTMIGATINRSGSFKYRATKVGADTAPAQIVKLVQEARNAKAPSQGLADRAAQWLVVLAIVIGLATFVVWFWWIGQTVLFAVTLTITVFVIACPDALGLATPMAVMVGTGLGAQRGVLFKNAAAIEEATKLERTRLGGASSR